MCQEWHWRLGCVNSLGTAPVESLAGTLRKKGRDMKFENLDAVQSLLDKTTTPRDRLETSLLLLTSKFAEMKDLAAPLQEVADLLEKAEGRNSRPNDKTKYNEDRSS
jgi:hypothetical protein